VLFKVYGKSNRLEEFGDFNEKWIKKYPRSNEIRFLKETMMCPTRVPSASQDLQFLKDLTN